MDCHKSKLCFFLSLFQYAGQDSYNRCSSHHQQTFNAPVNLLVVETRNHRVWSDLVQVSKVGPQLQQIHVLWGVSHPLHVLVTHTAGMFPQLSQVLLSFYVCCYNSIETLRTCTLRETKEIHFCYQNINYLCCTIIASIAL